MDRRSFVLTGAATLALGTANIPLASGRPSARAEDPWSRFDLTGRAADAGGVVAPEGFTVRVIARSQELVGGTRFEWPFFPDGGATFPTDDGWIYVCNSEAPNGLGGVSALRLDASGAVVDAYSILEGTSMNCAGGATPWGMWLSCEEYDLISPDGSEGEAGLVWECDPSRPGQGTPLPAMGAFQHEAVAVDADREQLYMTEDRPDGRLYRFTPDGYPDLLAGLLEVAVVADDSSVTWVEIPDPSGKELGPVRDQVPESTVFLGGEGMVAVDDAIFFTTKLDNKVWRYDAVAQSVEVIYSLEEHAGDLSGVDNITVTPAGDLLVAEDGGNMELVLVDEDGRTQPILRIEGEDHSELAGPAFDPSGQRLYFSSQRGGPKGVGTTYEMSGPFRAPEADPAPTTTAPAGDGGDGDEAAQPTSNDAGGGGTSWTLPALGGGAVLLGAAAVWRLRTRGSAAKAGDEPLDGEQTAR